MQSPGSGRYLITATHESAAISWYDDYPQKEGNLKRICSEWYTYNDDTNLTEHIAMGVVVTRIADGLDTAGRSWVTFQNRPSDTVGGGGSYISPHLMF